MYRHILKHEYHWLPSNVYA